MYPFPTKPPSTSREAHRAVLSLLTLIALLFSLAPGHAFALTAAEVQVRMVTDPLLVADSNTCSVASRNGPLAAYVGFRVANTSGGTLSNLSVSLGGFGAGFSLGGGQAATQRIGQLAAGESDTIYWLVAYPCHTVSRTLTVTVSDGGASADYVYSSANTPSTTSTVNDTSTITSSSMISANAGGQVTAATLGPGAIVGQVIPYNVTYSFGNVSNGDSFNMQPVGLTGFRADCFQLLNSEIVASQVSAIAATTATRDTLYFLATANQGGSGNTVQVRYYFQYLCDGVSTTTKPYASQTSGANNRKYTGNFDDATASGIPIVSYPAASQALTISKSASPTSLPNGGTVTYTVLINNTSVYNSAFSRITDVLPPGVTYGALVTGAGGTSAEIATLASASPAAGATGTLVWQGGQPSTYPYESFYIAAGGTLRLVYTASVPNTVGTYTNSATASVGIVTVGPASATVGVGAADVSITKSAPATASAGADIAYTITATNAAGSNDTNTTITDVLPAGVTFKSITPDAGWSCTTPAVGASGTVSCNNPSFTAGSSATITLVVASGAALPTGTVIGNTATIASSLDSTPANNSASASTTITSPALAAAKSAALVGAGAGDGVADPGDTLRYTITVANSGNAAATGATFADAIPANTAYVAGSTTLNGAAVADAAGAMPYVGGAPINTPGEAAGVLNPGESATIVFDVTVDSPLAPGVTRVQNQGVVRAAGLLDLPTDDPATATAGDPTVTPVIAAPLLAAAKSAALVGAGAGDGVADPGDTLRYTITVANTGNTAATGATFADAIPLNTAYVAGSTTLNGAAVADAAGAMPYVGGAPINTPGEAAGVLNPGESATIVFDVTVDSPLAPGVTRVQNQGVVRTAGLPDLPTDDPATATADDPTVTPVVAAPLLAASKSATLSTDVDGDGTPEPGDTLTYAVTVRNSGNTAATGVTFSDTPDANTALVVGSVVTSLGTVTSGNGAGDTAVGANLGTLAAGVSATIAFRVVIDSPLAAGVTQVSNQGVVRATGLPDLPTDDPSTPPADDPTSTAVTAAPALSAAKSATVAVDADANGQPSPGDTLAYAVTIHNSGNTAATGVTFSDTPDANTALLVGSVATDLGTVTSGNGAGDTAVAVSIGALPAGATATISFRVVIDSPLAAGVAQVSNQGVVRATGLPDLPTDDPSTPAGGDPTVTPVTAAPELSASKSASLAVDADSDGLPSPGDTLAYLITIISSGNTTATGVTFSDTPDANTALVAGSVSSSRGSVTAGNAVGASSVSVDLGAIPPGESATISFRVTIGNPLPAGVTQVSNQGQVSATNHPSLPTDDPSTPAGGDPTVTPVTADPVLGASKRATLTTDGDGDGIAEPGDTLTYALQIRNSGNTAATGVAFSDTPDANTALVVGSVATSLGAVTSGNSAGDTAVSVTIGALPAGATATISFRVTINSPLAAGVTQLSNQGQVSATNHPALSTDDPGTLPDADPTVTPVTAAPLLSATKSVSLSDDADANGQPSPGDTLTYAVQLKNTGNTAATGVSFTDTPDANTALVVGSLVTSLGTVADGNGAGDTSVTVTIASLPSGATADISFDVTIDSPLPAGVTQLSNQGQVSATNHPSLPTDDPSTPAGGDPTRTSVTGAPVLSASKSASVTTDADGNSQPSPGDTLTYVVQIQNSGNTAATGVAFSDTPDTNTALVVGSVVASLGTVTSGNSAGDTAVAVNVGSVPAGTTATISFRVTIGSPLPAGVTQLSNQGQVSATNHPALSTDDPTTPAGGDPTLTPIVAAPLIQASKTSTLAVDADGNGFASPGDTLGYQITVQNTGNQTGLALVAQDILDPNTTLVVGSALTSRGTITSGNSAGDTSVAAAIGALPGGEQATVSFQVRINNPLPAGVTQIANQATVSGGNFPIVTSDDPKTAPGDDPTRTPVVAAPVLTAAKSSQLLGDNDTNGIPSPGDTLLYTVLIANSGNTGATSVVLSDTPDSNTTLVAGSVQTTLGTITSGNAGAPPVTVAIGTLPAGAQVTLSFVVRIADPLPAGVVRVSNQGQLTSAELPPLPTDDPATLSVDDPTLTPVTAAPDLAADKAAQLIGDADGNGRVSPGDQLLYTITVVNRGNTEAPAVSFTDTPDPNTSLVLGSVQVSQGSVTGGNNGVGPITASLGTLPGRGGSATVTFRVTISPAIAVPTVVNQAQARTGAQVTSTNDPSTRPGGDPTITPITRDTTAITLAAFSASWVKGLPVVTWTTVAEVNSFGFHLYRGTTENPADAVRVTTELIPATGGGSSYSWQDSGAPGGQRYWYWLEELELDGSANRYGPAATPQLDATGVHVIYLPLVVR